MFTRKIKTISEGTERIDSIIKHMRKFWEKPLETSSESVNMHSAVMSALSLVKRQVYDHSIELITDLSDEEIKVHSNQVQFEQIIVNLVVNSIHSLDHVKKDKKWIRIILTKDVNHGIFEIHDNGTGIDEGIRDKIYDPLFTTKEPELGSGLGMAIVKSFIDRFNGEISNYNNADGGASFVVKFRLQQ
jgi:C4-dicarboxylate-specific signal transduction histidine kinase